MKSSVNSLLAILAVCDTLDLIFITPFVLSHFNEFALNFVFRQYFLKSRQSLTVLSNWCSATAIWIVVAVSVERVIMIRNPFRKEWSQDLVVQIICIISIVTFLLTFCDFYAYKCITRKLCNGTQIVGRCFDVIMDRWSTTTLNPVSQAQRSYVKWSTIINSFLTVLLPVTMLTCAKVALIRSVKNRNKMLRFMVENRADEIEHEKLLRHKTERKIEVTAVVVIICFIITQVPSAVVLSLRTVWKNGFSGMLWYNTKVLIIFLMIVGKVILFPIFYFSSENFRKRLTFMVKSQMSTKSRPSLKHQSTYTLIVKPQQATENHTHSNYV
uniref:G_PROTEIN_RECEP_F1_2 domain-containing protein n=1 Tax=Syphacia muris TaxID=451379 RepID=A0A0N5AW59_9BILA